jgi:hypothetical protein
VITLRFGDTDPTGTLPPDEIQGADAHDVIERWFRQPTGWGSFSAWLTPAQFRWFLVQHTDLQLPASDEEVLDAVVASWAGDLHLSGTPRSTA